MNTHKYNFLELSSTDTIWSPAQWLPFQVYQWLPRWPRYAPNPFLLNHPSYFYYNSAWHTFFPTVFPHSKPYRMLRAVTTNDLEEIITLLKKGFGVDSTIDPKYGYNALQLAAVTNHFPLIELLVMRGANINKTDQYGNTPLMLAVTNRNHEAIHSLLRNGADPSLANNYGLKPQDKASSLNIKQFLINYTPNNRAFPKFIVRLQFQKKLQNPFWKQILNWKVYSGNIKQNQVIPWQFDFSDYKLLSELVKTETL